MRIMLASCVIVILAAFQTNSSLYARLPQTSTAGTSQSKGRESRAVFVRVYSADAPGIKAPVTIRIGQMMPAQTVAEIAGTVEVEVTVGTDGYIRDAMIKKPARTA